MEAAREEAARDAKDTAANPSGDAPAEPAAKSNAPERTTGAADSTRKTTDPIDSRTDTGANPSGDRVTGDRTGNAPERTTGADAPRTGEPMQDNAAPDNAVERTADRIAGAADDARDSVSRALADDVMADTVKAAMTENGFDDLVERLADPDRNRIGDYAEQDFDDINTVVRSLNETFREKYDSRFRFQNESDVLSFVAFNEVQKDGRNTATVMLPAGANMPAVTLPLVSEGGTWRIDIADSMTGADLKANVLKHLKMIEGMKEQWPADRTEAYRAYTHHVLAAIAGQ